MLCTKFLDDLFVLVRDIPFSVSLQPKDEATQVAQLLVMGSGGCTAKHSLLGRFFTALGLQIIYLDFPFYWHEQEFLPEELRELAKGLPLSYHLACKVFFSGQWLFVDASWDKELMGVFPVNDPPFTSGYEGINAITPVGRPLFYWSIARRYSINNKPYLASKDKKLPFYLALNEYLKKIRTDFRST